MSSALAADANRFDVFSTLSLRCSGNSAWRGVWAFNFSKSSHNVHALFLPPARHLHAICTPFASRETLAALMSISNFGVCAAKAPLHLKAFASRRAK